MTSEKTQKIIADITQMKADIAKTKAELSAKIQANFHGVAKELFATYPELKSFGWTQYTPYFNDGEPCTFRSQHDYPTINGNDENSGENEQEEGVIDIVTNGSKTLSNSSTNWKDVPNLNYNPYYEEIVTTVKNFLNLFDDEDMLELFDDHVVVIITADGIKTEEYSHD